MIPRSIGEVGRQWSLDALHTSVDYLLGEWHEARAELLQESGQIEVALIALRAKYGLAMWLTDIGARLTGRFHKRAYIGVELTEEVGAG